MLTLCSQVSTHKKDLSRLILGIVMLVGGMLSGVWDVCAMTERRLKPITSRDGLSDMLVNMIYKDSTGYIWFGTEESLDRYDGNNITSYRFPADRPGSRRVTSITELGRGDIYAGNNQGLYLLRRGSNVPEPFLADKIGGAVNALADDGKENLYIGTQQGLYRYNTKKKHTDRLLLKTDILAPDNEISSIVMMRNGELWATGSHGIYKVDFESGKSQEYRMPCDGRITRMMQMGQHIYVATSGSGVVPFNLGSRTFEAPIEVGNNLITSLGSGENEIIYISTDGEGIYLYDTASNRILAHYDSSEKSEPQLRSGSVYSLLKDREGMLWIGYYQDGADYTPYTSGIFDVYEYPGVIDTRKYAVRSVALNGSEKVIGTREGLFYIDEKSGRHASFAKPRINSNIIFCIKRIGSLYYIGTYNGGMYVLDPSALTLRPFGREEGVGGNLSVFDIGTDREGTIWVAASDGLHRFRGNRRIAHYTSQNSRLPEGNVYLIKFDSAGRGWAATETGLAIWNGKNLQTDHFPKGFPDNKKIRVIYEDREHNLYFAPDRGEVIKSNLSLTRFGAVKGATGRNINIVTSIAEDKEGSLWLGTDRGAIRYDKGDKFEFFSNADGLPHQVFTLCASVADSSGDIWMGNSQGLIRLDFERYKSASAKEKPKANISDLRSNGQSITGRLRHGKHGDVIDLGSDDNDLEIQFGNLSFIERDHHQVEYILEGYDKEWRRAEGGKPAQYYKIPPGSYRLRVREAGDPDSETFLEVNKSGGYMIWAIIILVVLMAGATAAGLAIYFRRRAARGASGEEERAEAGDYDDSAEEKRERGQYRTTSLSREECERLMKAIDHLMRSERPFTDAKMKSADLARMVGTKAHSLSYLFNQYMHTTYYDFVNGYRVEEFKRLARETDTDRYTLTALSQMCGFSSRASFFRHFKAATGITPAEYLKQIKRGQS